MQSEMDKKQAKWDREITQGRKIEQLVNHDEWKFLEGWVRASYEEITGRIMRGDFLSNLRTEDFNKGVASGLKMIIDGANQFITKKRTAEAEAKRYEESKND